MKNLKLLLLGAGLFFSTTQAQVSVNVNIGTPPAWAPAEAPIVEYYYLPDVESYYDVRSQRFIYLSNGNWIHARHLPGRYRGYDLYSGYKVVLTDYHGAAPYVHYNEHKVKYYKGYKGAPQKTRGVKPVKVYKAHPGNSGNAHKANGNGKGHGNRKGKGHH